MRISLRLRSTEQRSTLRIPTLHGNEHRMSVTMGCFGDMSPREFPLRISLIEDILWAADALNSLPRKNLGYCTPEELFEAFLDIVCAA